MAENVKSGERRRSILLGLAILLAMALGLAVYWFFFMRGIVYTDDARFDGHLVDLAPQVNGKLVEVYVHEGDRVSKGELVFALEKKAFQAAASRAESEAASARSALEVASAEYQKAIHGPRKEEIKIAESAKLVAEAELSLAEANWERARTLFEKHDITASSRDKARTAWETARQAQQEAAHRLQLLVKGTRSEDLDIAKANMELKESQLAAAEHAVNQAGINLDYTEVRALSDGYIVRRWRDPGTTVAAGTPIVTMLDPTTLYISANVEEKDLDHLSVGNQAYVSVDAYPELKLTGYVSRIMRATNSNFSLIPSEGVSGTYIKVTQRVPIRVTLDTIPNLLLGPGLSVEVSIHYLQPGRKASQSNPRLP